MKKKSTIKRSAAMTAVVRPMIVQAIHTGMKVLRNFSDPISRKRAADPINKITVANKMLTVMPEIRSLWRRFLRAVSVSCTYSLRASFISLNSASIISLTEVN